MAFGLRQPVLLSLVVSLALAWGAAARAQLLNKGAVVCQQAIGREGQKFKKAKLKAWQKCLNAHLDGKPCDTAARDAAISAAENRFVTNVGKHCTAAVAFTAPPDGVGFPQSCDFEAGPLEPAEEACRSLPVTNAAELTRCLICWKQAELHELLQILFACLANQIPAGSDLNCGTPPPACPTDKGAILCSKAIGKAGMNFFIAKEKAVEQCLDGVNKGKPGPCPDANALAKINAAEQKKVAQIQKCTQAPPWWDVCPESCQLTIGSVADITSCIDTAGEEIADEVVCQQYRGAAGHGITCPPGDGDTTTTTTSTTSTTAPPPPPCTSVGAPCGSCTAGGMCAPLCDPTHGTCTLACMITSFEYPTYGCTTDAQCAPGRYCVPSGNPPPNTCPNACGTASACVAPCP